MCTELRDPTFDANARTKPKGVVHMAYRIHGIGRTNSISTGGVRVLQAMLVAVVLAACLLLVPILGRGRAPAVQHPFNPQEFASYMCTGHVPSPACASNVGRGVGHTAHVPAGDPRAPG